MKKAVIYYRFFVTFTIYKQKIMVIFIISTNKAKTIMKNPSIKYSIPFRKQAQPES